MLFLLLDEICTMQRDWLAESVKEHTNSSFRVAETNDSTNFGARPPNSGFAEVCSGAPDRQFQKVRRLWNWEDQTRNRAVNYRRCRILALPPAASL